MTPHARAVCCCGSAGFWALLAGIGAYLLLLRTLVVTQNPGSLVRIVVALLSFIALMLTLVAARRAEASRAPQMSSL